MGDISLLFFKYSFQYVLKISNKIFGKACSVI